MLPCSRFPTRMMTRVDCSRFRHQHLEYLDHALPRAVMSAAQLHLLACDACAAHDALVRRSLMAVRSLPTAEPSAAFAQRLQARLAACRAEERMARSTRLWQAHALTLRAERRARVSRAALLVAASAVAGVLALHRFRAFSPVSGAAPPVMALSPAPMPSPAFSPVITPARFPGLAPVISSVDFPMTSSMLIPVTGSYTIEAH